MRNISFFFMILLILSSIGCAGARGHMKLDTLKYPVSMSAYLYGPKDRLLSKDTGLEPVGDFKYEKRFWGIFWSMIPLSDDKDIAEAINSAIAEKGGDGMINFAVTSSSCDQNNLFFITCLYYIPLCPGCTNTEVKGLIVKYVLPENSK